MELLTDVDREVLRGYAENDMNISRTAAALYMHRNGVCYHLAKVQRITGLNPKKFEDLSRLVWERKE